MSGSPEDDENVVILPVVTRLGVPVDRVLRGGLKAGLTGVVLVGWDADGQEYFASSESDGAEVLWMLERAKLKLLQVVESMVDNG